MLTGRKLPLTLAFVVLIGLAFGASCRGFFVKPTLTSIGVTPGTKTITDGTTDNTQQFQAVGTFDDNSHGSTPVTWGSSDPNNAIATLSSSGLATGVGTGTVTITAQSTIIPTISGTATLTVVPANVTSIHVSPQNTGTSTGNSFSLLAKDQDGHDISGSVTWTFTLNGTVETGMTKGALDSNGQLFTVGTLNPAVTTFPAPLDVVASLTTSSGTVTSIAVTVTLSS